MKARVGPIYGSGGFLSDVFFFQVGGPITAGLISGRGAYIGGGEGGYYRMNFFIHASRWAYNFGLISGRGAYWRGGGVGLLSYVLFSR